MQISYDLYDEMCIALSKLGNEDVEVPSWETIKKLERCDLSLMVGLFAYIGENAGVETEDEKKRLAYINRILLDKVEFFEGDEPAAEIGAVPEDTYFTLDKMAEACSDFMQKDVPDIASLSECIKPYIKYCFFLAYFFYFKAKDEETKKFLKTLMTENYVLEWAQKPVEITETEFERLKKDCSSSRYGDNDWLPSVDEIRTYIVPNFDKCYDFALWLMGNTSKSKTKSGKEAVALLKRLFRKKVRILDKNGRRMETIWS